MPKSLTIAMVAGELSGDNLAAPLIRELSRKSPEARFIGIGGPAMAQAGLNSWIELDRLSVNGLVDPIRRLPELIRILTSTRDRLIEAAPDVFVGVDFNVFNLLLEGMLKKAGIKTVHYVSPSVWAWRRGRIKRIARNVDLMLTLYPFETAIYEQSGINACFVGHPKADEINPSLGLTSKHQAREDLEFYDTDKVLAILPGSRGGEIKLSLPGFLETARICVKTLPELKIVIPAANDKRRQQISTLISEDFSDLNIRLLDQQSQQAMLAADMVLVNSGTATLEAMLLKRPMVMSYRLGSVTYAIVSKMLKTDKFALPNILSGEFLVPEFIQDKAVPDKMAEKVLAGLLGAGSEDLMRKFDDIHHLLRRNAAQTAAEAVLAEVDR